MGYFPRLGKKEPTTKEYGVVLKSKEKGPKEVKSYRPVCLLPILSKILERLIQVKIKEVILRPGFPSGQQFGYR